MPEGWRSKSCRKAGPKARRGRYAPRSHCSALGLHPKRALRIVLFSGEEQGLLGSRAYVAAHRGELDRIQAVLEQATGSGRVTGFPDMRNDAW